MKIRNDQLNALQQQEQAKAKKQEAKPGLFDELLTQEVQRNGTGADKSTQAAPPPGKGLLGVGGLLHVQAAASPKAAESTEQVLMDKIETLLERWENYADTLGSEEASGSLRKAYGMLENLSSGVEQLREAVPNLAEKNPELNALVNELEVMATTEQFKFNRGDYFEET